MLVVPILDEESKKVRGNYMRYILIWNSKIQNDQKLKIEKNPIKLMANI